MNNPLKKRPAETITLATGVAAVVAVLVFLFPRFKEIEATLVLAVMFVISALPYVVSTIVDKLRKR